MSTLPELVGRGALVKGDEVLRAANFSPVGRALLPAGAAVVSTAGGDGGKPAKGLAPPAAAKGFAPAAAKGFAPGAPKGLAPGAPKGDAPPWPPIWPIICFIIISAIIACGPFLTIVWTCGKKGAIRELSCCGGGKGGGS